MILDRFRMEGKVVVITGASKGIGRGLASTFAEVGARVVCAARTTEAVEAAAQQLTEDYGVEALAVTCDVTERAALEALVARSLERFGRIDVLVNNAGGGPHKPALRTSERTFEHALRFNVTSAFLLSRLVAPHMLEAGGGNILNISSSIGRVVGRGFVAYGTAKAALIHMTRLLASEFAPKVRVNALALGAIETEALAGFLRNEAVREGLESKTPMRSIGTVEDAAAAALYLCSPAGGWMTGKILEVDGGITASNSPFELPDL